VSAPKSETRDGRLRWNRKLKQPKPAGPPAEAGQILTSGVPE
jgi:hypothetical protein